MLYTKKEKELLSILCEEVYEEAVEKFTDILKLDYFPTLGLNFDYKNISKRNYTTPSFLYSLIEDKSLIKSIHVDHVDLNMVPLRLYFRMIDLIDDDLDYRDLQLFKLTMRILYIEELIKCHDIKYFYNRFINSSVFKPTEKIMEDLIEDSMYGEILLRTKGFLYQNDKLDIISDNIINLLLNQIYYFEDNGTLKGIDEDKETKEFISNILEEFDTIL